MRGLLHLKSEVTSIILDQERRLSHRVVDGSNLEAETMGKRISRWEPRTLSVS